MDKDRRMIIEQELGLRGGRLRWDQKSLPQREQNEISQGRPQLGEFWEQFFLFSSVLSPTSLKPLLFLPVLCGRCIGYSHRSVLRLQRNRLSDPSDKRHP